MRSVQKQKDLKAAFKAFFITFTCCLAAFLLVALVSVSGHNKKDAKEKTESAAKADRIARIFFIYKDDDVRFAEITLSLGSSEFACREVTDVSAEINKRRTSLKEVYLTRGTGETVSVYEKTSGQKMSGYITADRTSLIRIINRFGGLDGEDGFAVSGEDALKNLETEGLDRLLYKTVARFFSPYQSLSLKNRFLYLIGVTESNLSYAQYHRNAEYLEFIEEGQR